MPGVETPGYIQASLRDAKPIAGVETPGYIQASLRDAKTRKQSNAP